MADADIHADHATLTSALGDATVNETYQRSAVREIVELRTRAVPRSRRRASLRVDS
jgi:hypothetical protein